MIKYIVERPKDICIVVILPHKSNGKYSFINLTKEHICPCEFDSIEDAIKDMDNQIKEGKIIKYTKSK